MQSPRPLVADPPPAEETLRVDGRRERGNRNRSAVVSALLELYALGEFAPSAARIADIAGVSERSVFRYFDDMDDLASAAVQLQWDRVKSLYLDLDSSGDFDTRVTSIVDHRLRVYESVAGAFHAASMTALRLPAVARAVEERRKYLRSQTHRQFHGELEVLVDSSIRQTILDHVLSLENIDYLANSVGLAPAAIRETLIAGVALVLRP